MIVKQITLTVTENTRLADGIYRLRLAGDTSAITAPGLFVNLNSPVFSSAVPSPCATGPMEN